MLRRKAKFMPGWNPWHGCHKISPGCANCYVYSRDGENNIDSGIVRKTAAFDLPVKKNRSGGYKIVPGEFVWTCFTSDFLLSDADEWRPEAWDMMRKRNDLTFLFITKRIERFLDAVPEDWGSGYDNVRVCCTVEDQKHADIRLPIFRDMPIKYKAIVCEPLLGPINLTPYLGPWVKSVSVGGESGSNARVCDYQWVTDIREQCVHAHVPFSYHQTGARLKKGARVYYIPRKAQLSQAKKANIDFWDY